MEKEIDCLKEYVEHGVIIYFKTNLDYKYASFTGLSPFTLTVEDIPYLIDKRKDSIEKLEKELSKL